MLLAEDNLINQTVAKKMLTVLGMVCEVACNGQEGVDAVKRGAADGRPFDCVLMDMAMPIMGGVEAARVRHPSSTTSPCCQRLVITFRQKRKALKYSMIIHLISSHLRRSYRMAQVLIRDHWCKACQHVSSTLMFCTWESVVNRLSQKR